MAERLTDHELDNYNDPGCQNCSDYCWRSCKEDDAVKDCAQRLIYNRLAAYEDTGLTPEEVTELKEATTDAWLQLRTATFSTDKGAADLAKFILSILPEAPKEANNDESGN